MTKVLYILCQRKFNANMLIQEHKNKTITPQYMRFYHGLTNHTPTSTNERKSFHYIIENITKNITTMSLFTPLGNFRSSPPSPSHKLEYL